MLGNLVLVHFETNFQQKTDVLFIKTPPNLNSKLNKLVVTNYNIRPKRVLKACLIFTVNIRKNCAHHAKGHGKIGLKVVFCVPFCLISLVPFETFWMQNCTENLCA